MTPPRTALLVIDMQKVFAPTCTAIPLPKIQLLMARFRSIRAPVIVTQHGHPEEELAASPSPNQLVRRWGREGSIARGSASWELLDEIARELPAEEDGKSWPELIHKNTYDAFINTNMADVLESAKVQRVIVCGVKTDFCCDTTARSAFNRGYETWLVSDACGSSDETQHQEGLRAFEKAYGDVLTTDHVLKRLEEEGIIS